MFVYVFHGPASDVAHNDVIDPFPPDTQNVLPAAFAFTTFAGNTSVTTTDHPEYAPQFENEIWKHTVPPGYWLVIGFHDVSVACFHSFMHNCGESVASTHAVCEFGMLITFVPPSVSSTEPPDGRLNVAEAKFVSNWPLDNAAWAVPASHSVARIDRSTGFIRCSART